MSMDADVGSSAENAGHLPAISVVVIGRNEGERLALCFKSIQDSDYPADRLELIYVDSNSTDGSCEIAKRAGARVIRITEGPLSAARGRNLGWRTAVFDFVHFVDGDTELDRHWFRKAVATLEDGSAGCVFGRCTELRPSASLYMRVCNLDWHVPSGPCRYCGGIALFRRDLLQRLGGFCEEMRAGEEPELCYRLRAIGAQVWRLDEPMAIHDLNMTRFAGYWRRSVRSGWAYSVVAARCCNRRERLWFKENVINVAEIGLWTLLVLCAFLWRSPSILIVLIVVWLSRVLWISVKVRGRTDGWGSALLYGVHCQFVRIPLAVGQIRGLLFLIRQAGGRFLGHKSAASRSERPT